MAVKVTTMGKETQEVPYREKMTVADALKAAGVEASKDATITVDGKKADQKSKLTDDAQVVVTPMIDQG